MKISRRKMSWKLGKCWGRRKRAKERLLEDLSI